MWDSRPPVVAQQDNIQYRNTVETQFLLPDEKSGTAQSAESGPSYGPSTPSSIPVVIDEGCATAQQGPHFLEQEKKQQEKNTKKLINAFIDAHNKALPVDKQLKRALYHVPAIREAALALIEADFTVPELVQFVRDTYGTNELGDYLPAPTKDQTWARNGKRLSLQYFANHYPDWRATSLELRPPALTGEPERKRIPMSLEEDPFLNGSMYKPVQP